MKIKIYNTLTVIAIALTGQLMGDNRIVMYLQHAPASITNQVKTDPSTGTTANAAIINETIKPSLGGIPALYGGYIDTTTHDGLLSFPLRQAAPKLYIAITPRIQLVNIKKNTFSHRGFDPEVKTMLYLCEQKKDAKGQSYWEVNEDKVPADNIINPLTLVLLTDPNNVILEPGKHMAAENAQLVLPSVYLVSRAKAEESVIKSLEIRPFFEPISLENKKATETSLQNMITHL